MPIFPPSLANCPLLVSSCDPYWPCWDPFFHGLNKYWPQHPPVRMIANHRRPPQGEPILVGDDQGWAQNLRFALEQIPEEIILYGQEDYWLKQPVDHGMLQDYFALMVNGRADYIRLCPSPPPDRVFPDDPRLGIIAPTAEYRTSLQLAFWRKKVLLDLLLPNESAWQFEARSTARSAQYQDRFLCVAKRRFGVDYVFTAVINGRWIKEAYQYAKDEAISVAFDQLPPKSRLKVIEILVRQKLFKIKKVYHRLSRRN